MACAAMLLEIMPRKAGGSPRGLSLSWDLSSFKESLRYGESELVAIIITWTAQLSIAHTRASDG